MSDRRPAAGYRTIGFAGHLVIYRPLMLTVLLVIAFTLLAGAATALVIGSSSIPLTVVTGWLSDGDADALTALIVGELRLPRITLAMLCGAALGAAGAVMQSVTRNGLADPGLIGVKEGTVMAVIAMLLFFPQAPLHWRPFIGLAGGGGVALLVITIARSTSGLRFVLLGIGVSWLLSSGISLFMTMARMNEVQTAMIWLGGSLHAASWLDLRLVLPWIAAGYLLLVFTSRSANVALLGEMAAEGLGVKVRWLNGARLVAAILLTSACASVVGGLGFVGLMAPHLARLCFGSQQGVLVTGSSLFGAMLVLGADTLGRTVFAPIQIPAGIATAILGLPFFLLLLWQRRNAI